MILTYTQTPLCCSGSIKHSWGLILISTNGLVLPSFIYVCIHTHTQFGTLLTSNTALETSFVRIVFKSFFGFQMWFKPNVAKAFKKKC